MLEAAQLVRLPAGGALHIVDGPSDAVPLLFLHGVGGAAWSWRPQVAALAGAYPLLVWEARGHGDAATIEDAGLGDYLIDAREALAYAIDRFRRPVGLVGHSMGGLLAMTIAADTAAAVAGLFLVDPVYAGDFGAFGHAGAFAPLARLLVRPLVDSYKKKGTVARAISRYVFTHSFENREMMERAWVDQRRAAPVEYPKMMYEAFDGPSNYPRRDFALEVDGPVFLLEGSSSRRAPRFPSLVRKMRERLGDTFTFEVVAGGHYLQLDNPEAVNERILAFAAALSR